MVRGMQQWRHKGSTFILFTNQLRVEQHFRRSEARCTNLYQGCERMPVTAIAWSHGRRMSIQSTTHIHHKLYLDLLAIGEDVVVLV